MRDKYKTIALLCLAIFLIVASFIIFGCAETQSKPFPESYSVPSPSGYIQHCIDYPNSVFCKDNKK